MIETRIDIPPPPPAPLPGFDFNCSIGGYNVRWARWQILRGRGMLSFLTWLLFHGNVSDGDYRKIQHIERQAARTCHFYDRSEFHYHLTAGEACS